jgi:hypothetical protein
LHGESDYFAQHLVERQLRADDLAHLVQHRHQRGLPLGRLLRGHTFKLSVMESTVQSIFSMRGISVFSMAVLPMPNGEDTAS